ncbi:MAG: hypothetical protein JWN76_356 [Chitinophagaceae bacterium]|nr:hypothetical protein [Chitinophagaceae bacterium]
MKKLLAALLLIICSAVNAQQEQLPAERGFKKENVFAGGMITLGASSGTFLIGAIPEIGYSVTPWFDAGVQTNLSYQTMSARYFNGYRQRNFNYGAGAFVRLYPLNFIFVQLQPEHNWNVIKIKDVYNGGTNETFHQQSNSLLAGIGYANRVIGQSNFYVLLMLDLMTDINSPYRDNVNQATPVIRTGFNFYLHPSKRR